MAVTKIWRIKGKAGNTIDYALNKKKTTFSESDTQALADVIEYAANEDKTEQRYFTTAINCSLEYAKDQFELTKTRFDKKDGTVAFHAYQSFAEGEATPEQAHELGVALARELWGEKFQIIVATHLNTKCLHNHFVINSVSFKDGIKFHSSRADYRHIREVSDRLCREHGLSVIEEPKSKGKSYRYYQMEQAGMPTRYNVAKQALDDAISKSCNLHELKANLNSMGYQCNLAQNRKYWTITLPGWKKPIRTYKLGEEYTRDRIQERVYSNNQGARLLRVREMYKRTPQYTLKRRVDKIMGRSGLEKLYLRYCYELGYLPKYTQRPSKVHSLLRDELLKCDMYSEEAKLLVSRGVSSIEELLSLEDTLAREIDVLESERNELRLKARRKIPEDERSLCKEQIASKTAELRKLRHELKLTTDIKERSKALADTLTDISKDKHKEVHR